MAGEAPQKVKEDVKKITTSPLAQTAAKDVKPFQAFLTKFNNDWATSFAGLLAYSLLTAMLPIAVALFGILGLIMGSNSSLTHTIAQSIANAVPSSSSSSSSPPATAQAIELAINELNKQAGFLLIIAILLAIFGGSRLFITLENCLDIVYRVRPRTVIRQNLIAFAMLLLFIVLIPIMVFVSAAPTFLLSVVKSYPLLQSIPFFSTVLNNGVIVYLAGIVGGLIVGFILFEAIYFVVPNQHISWRNSWRGALAAAVALELFLVLFPVYISVAMRNYTGQIGFAVILLLFFYYFAVILMLGAEVNAFFFEGVRPLPNNLATFVSTMGGKLNQDIPQSESPSHINPRPTDQADQAHIERAQAHEQQIQQKDGQEPRRFAFKALSKDHARTQPKRSGEKQSSKLPIAAEVVAGSALALIVEWLRLRQEGK